MKLIIRQSEKRDEIQIIKLQSELQETEHAIDKNRNTGIDFAKKYLKFIRKEISRKSGDMFVAEMNNEIAGLLTVLIEDNEIEENEGCHLYVSDIVVGKSYRRQGIAEKLMVFAEKFAKERGIKEIHLGVLSKNTAAFNLYQKKGYKPKKIELVKKLK
jgi:ribosomal protein S18 acetylase RimI-like enzyme